MAQGMGLTRAVQGFMTGYNWAKDNGLRRIQEEELRNEIEAKRGLASAHQDAYYDATTETLPPDQAGPPAPKEFSNTDYIASMMDYARKSGRPEHVQYVQKIQADAQKEGVGELYQSLAMGEDVKEAIKRFNSSGSRIQYDSESAEFNKETGTLRAKNKKGEWRSVSIRDLAALAGIDLKTTKPEDRYLKGDSFYDTETGKWVTSPKAGNSSEKAGVYNLKDGTPISIDQLVKAYRTEHNFPEEMELLMMPDDAQAVIRKRMAEAKPFGQWAKDVYGVDVAGGFTPASAGPQGQGGAQIPQEYIDRLAKNPDDPAFQAGFEKRFPGQLESTLQQIKQRQNTGSQGEKVRAAPRGLVLTDPEIMRRQQQSKNNMQTRELYSNTIDLVSKNRVPENSADLDRAIAYAKELGHTAIVERLEAAKEKAIRFGVYKSIPIPSQGGR